MKPDTQTIEVKAWHARSIPDHANRRLQQQAEVVALNKGDFREARRARNAGIDLGEKQKQRLARMQRLGIDTGWIIRDLGGARDPIAMMLKARQLSTGQAMAAINLRAYERGEAVSAGGVAAAPEIRSGGQISGMEAHCDRLRSGRMAKQRAEDAVSAELWTFTYRIIMGRCGVDRASRAVPGKTEVMAGKLKAAVADALDAAGAYMEVAA